MKKIITISLLVLSLCIMLPARAAVPDQESVAPQKSESQKISVESKSQAVQSQSKSSSIPTTKKNTTHEVTRRQSTTEAEEVTSTEMTSTNTSATTSTSGNNSVLFGKNKMLAIAAWSLIGIGVLFVLIVVLGGKSRRNRRPFQKSTKRYKNRSKYNNYSDRYRSNIKRK